MEGLMEDEFGNELLNVPMVFKAGDVTNLVMV